MVGNQRRPTKTIMLSLDADDQLYVALDIPKLHIQRRADIVSRLIESLDPKWVFGIFRRELWKGLPSEGHLHYCVIYKLLHSTVAQHLIELLRRLDPEVDAEYRERTLAQLAQYPKQARRVLRDHYFNPEEYRLSRDETKLLIVSVLSQKPLRRCAFLLSMDARAGEEALLTQEQRLQVVMKISLTRDDDTCYYPARLLQDLNEAGEDKHFFPKARPPTPAERAVMIQGLVKGFHETLNFVSDEVRKAETILTLEERKSLIPPLMKKACAWTRTQTHPSDYGIQKLLESPLVALMTDEQRTELERTIVEFKQRQ